MVSRRIPSMVQHAPSKSSDPGAWMEEAACAGMAFSGDFRKNGDPFFPTSVAPAAAQEAQALCGGCRVKDTCGFYASADKDSLRYGIFGGTTPEERIRVKRRNERSRRASEKEESK